MNSVMNIIIKPFGELTPLELYEILRLRSEVFVVEQNCIYNDADGWDVEAFHLFILKDDTVVATARILPAQTRFAQISVGRVVVDPSARGQNLGKLIMRRAIEFASAELDATEIKISAQLYLERFYGNLGFRVVTGVYDEDGIPHVGMLWKKL
jgi:ElaA protein